MPRMRRLSLVAALICSVMVWARAGLADEESKQRCVSAYEDAQVSMRKGSLTKAREELVYCGGAQCPEVMHGDCQRWLSEVEASIPTVVFQVKTPTGRLVERASVSIDGGDPMPIDGHATSADPGEHQVSFTARGFATLTRSYTFSEGEKLRRETVVLEANPLPRGIGKNQRAAEATPSESEEPSAATAGLTLPIMVASTAAVIGGIGFGYFGLRARSEDRDLGSCSPNCSQVSVDNTKRDYLLANVSFGIAAASLATAAVLVVVELRSRRSLPSQHVGLGFNPAALRLSVDGRF